MTNENQTTDSSAASQASNQKKFQLPKTVSIKAIVIFLVIVAAVGLLYYYRSVFIAATVDGKLISRLAVIKELEKQSGQEALDALINEKLINNAANEQDVTVSDQEIDDQIKFIESQVTKQGGTLDQALEAQGISKDDFRKQISLQKKAEKLLGDKINVSDDDINKYLQDNELTLTAGAEESERASYREELKQQKFSEHISTWLADTRAQAKIINLVNY